MATCRRCGKDTGIPNKKICNTCLGDWDKMRTIIWDSLTKIYGKFSPANDAIFKSETKRLDNMWRKNKDKFQEEIESMNQ